MILPFNLSLVRYWRLILVCLLVVLPSCKTRESLLEQRIDTFEMTESAGGENGTDPGFGGATMADAVAKLRFEFRIPVSFEELRYDKPNQKLTLARVVKKLEDQKATAGLTQLDERRLVEFQHRSELLDRLRKIKGKKGMSEEEQALVAANRALFDSRDDAAHLVIGSDKKTFRVSDRLQSVAQILEHLTVLDADYRWSNEGTQEQPIIVVEPRDPARSRLAWKFLSSCGDARPQTTAKSPAEMQIRAAFDPGSPVLKQFSEAGVEVFRGNRESSPVSAPRHLAKLPVGILELCGDKLTARDLLVRTVRAAGTVFFWNVQAAESDGVTQDQGALSFDAVP